MACVLVPVNAQQPAQRPRITFEEVLRREDADRVQAVIDLYGPTDFRLSVTAEGYE